MPTYPEEIIADNPIAYARLNDVDPSVTVMENLGTGADGTYFSDNIRGIASPIETDPTSFAFRWRVGTWPASVETLGNFTWEVWCLHSPANTFNSLIFRGGQLGLSASNYLAIDGGNVRFQVTTTTGGTIDMQYALPEFGWYHIVGRRNGTVAELLVNTVQRGISSALGGGPLTGWGISDLPSVFHIGVGTTSNAFQSYGTDEPAIYDYPLSDARLLAHYEAALNSLSLFGVSNVIPSAVLYSDVEPDPINFPFRHNWADPLIERISFTTGISRAVKGYEQGNAQRIKPRREIEISQMLRDEHERESFRAKLNAQQNRKWFIPILEDRERLTAPIAAGVQVIPTSTLYKDYEIGGYAELRQLNNAGRVTASEQLLITGLEDEEVQTATQTLNSYPNPEVMPARRGIISASQSLRGHTDSVEDTTILARLIAEDEKSIPHRIVPWTPTVTYKSYEVYPNDLWPNDWSELRDYSVERDTHEVDHELGAFTVESDALAANEAFSWRILLETKQQQAEFLGWFYARAGSLNYLWVPSMQRNFSIVSVAGSNLTVAGHNYFDNFAGSEFRRDLAFIYNDNTMAFARINDVALSGANEVLALSTMPTQVNLRSVSYLLFCRLDNDTLEIARITDTKVRMAWLFREILSSPA